MICWARLVSGAAAADPNASLDTNMDDLGSTKKCMATMATFIIWSLWQYYHSGHRDNR